MEKRTKKLFCLLLLMCLCFSEVIISPTVNTTVSEAKKKKKKDKYANYPKEWKYYVDNKHYVYINKYSKSFTKYLSYNKMAKEIQFNYTGNDEIVHLPAGLFRIKSFAPKVSEFNTSIKKICMYDSFSKWNEATYFSREGDRNWYTVFYQCANLEKIQITWSNELSEQYLPHTNADGTWLYDSWNNGVTSTFWKYGERIPITDW